MISALAISGCAPANGSAALPSSPGSDEAVFASTSLCADSYLLALIPEDRIDRLSWQAGSPLSTATAQPDPGLWESRETLAAFRRETPRAMLLRGPGIGRASTRGDLGLTLGYADDLDAVAQEVARVADWAGVSADAVLREIDAVLEAPPAALTAAPTAAPPAAPTAAEAPRLLYLSRGGGTTGPDSYVGRAMTRAGGVNVIETGSWQTLSPERILSLDPDIIVTSFFGSDYAGVGDRAVRHAALRDYISARPRIDVPGKFWPCAGPGLIEATRIIKDGVQDWAATTEAAR